MPVLFGTGFDTQASAIRAIATGKPGMRIIRGVLPVAVPAQAYSHHVVTRAHVRAVTNEPMGTNLVEHTAHAPIVRAHCQADEPL